ncbi:MAG: hypothetical protein ACFE7I_05285 [Candidatus Hodarchaeota archaeon]
MSEQIEDLISRMKEGLVTLAHVRIGLFDAQGNCLYGTLSEEAETVTRGIIARSFPTWDSGDYQVKHLERGCLLISRVSDKLALAIDSYEREGLVIMSLGTLLRRFKKDFGEIDDMLPGAAIAPSVPAEPSRPVPAAPTTPAPPTTPASTPEPVSELEEPTLEPPPGEEAELSETADSVGSISPDAILVVSEPSVNKLELDSDMLSLLRVIDGKRTMREVAKTAAIPLKRASSKIASLVETKAAKLISHPFEDEISYQRVYELVPPYTPDTVVETACAGRSPATCTLMANLDHGYTVLELTDGLKKVGFDKKPEEILEALEYYRTMGVARVKAIGSESVSEEWSKNAANHQIYEFTPEFDFEKSMQNLLVKDRKVLVTLKNLDRGYSILEITQGLRSMGFKITPSGVLRILEDLEKRGIARLRKA